MSDVEKIVAANQKKMVQLVSQIAKKSSVHQNAQDSLFRN